MAERIRSIVVKIYVDTNKQTYERQLVCTEDETHEQFEKRVVEMIEQLTEVA